MTNERAIEIFKEIKAECEAKQTVLSNQIFIHEGIEALDMAIKALEQQPCDDCISREVVIDGLDKYIEKAQSTGTKDDFISFQELVVKQLPSVTPKARWIPVSERLPDKGYSVLVMRITDDGYKYMRAATYQGDCWMDNTDEFNKPNPHKVIAWMPLPQPYAESEE